MEEIIKDYTLRKKVDFPSVVSMSIDRMNKWVREMDREVPEHLNRLYDMLSSIEDQLEYHADKSNAPSLKHLRKISTEIEKMDAFHDTDEFRKKLKRYRKFIIKVAGESKLLIDETDRADKYKR